MPKLLDAPDIFGHTIFCDDIRMEIDGKFTYVGAYGGRMYVNAPFPVTIAKFAFSVLFYQLKERFVPNLGLWIFLPGDSDEQPSIKGEFTEVSEGAMLRQVEQDPLPSDHQTKYIGVIANVVAQHLVLKEPGAITVRVLRGDELYRVGRLVVLQGNIATPPNEPSPPS